MGEVLLPILAMDLVNMDGGAERLDRRVEFGRYHTGRLLELGRTRLGQRPSFPGLRIWD